MSIAFDKVIATDNFFADPYSVIELAKKQTYYKRNPNQYFEGIRTPNIQNVDGNFYNQVATSIVYNYFDKNKIYAIEGCLYFHIHSANDAADPNWIYGRIHKDKAVLSSIAYLTPDLPTHYGTEIYREINGKYILDISLHNKFNRLIQFPSHLPHCAMNMPETHIDRLTLLFFLNKIEEKNDN